jgi:hypothetical protein
MRRVPALCSFRTARCAAKRGANMRASSRSLDAISYAWSVIPAGRARLRNHRSCTMVFTDVTVLWLGVAVAIVLTVVAMVHFTRPPAPGARR